MLDTQCPRALCFLCSAMGAPALHVMSFHVLRNLLVSFVSSGAGIFPELLLRAE